MSQNNANTSANASTAEGANNNSTPLTYKQQLDEAAAKIKYPEPENKGGIVNQVVEKGRMHPFPPTLLSSTHWP